MSLLSGIGLGSRRVRSGARAAVHGLGRILHREGGDAIKLTKASRRVVADFINGEMSKASCSKSTGQCDIESTGRSLRVGTHTLAERVGTNPANPVIKVCIPSQAEMQTVVPARGKPFKREKPSSREKRGAVSALMQILGSGIRVQRNVNEELQFASGMSRPKGGRVLVPGQCVEVRVTPEMSQHAALMLYAASTVQSAGRAPTRGAVRKAARKIKAQANAAQAAAKKQARQAAAAKARATKQAKVAAAAQKKAMAAAKRKATMAARNPGGGGAITLYRPGAASRPAAKKTGPRRGKGGRFVKG